MRFFFHALLVGCLSCLYKYVMLSFEEIFDFVRQIVKTTLFEIYIILCYTVCWLKAVTIRTNMDEGVSVQQTFAHACPVRPREPNIKNGIPSSVKQVISCTIVVSSGAALHLSVNPSTIVCKLVVCQFTALPAPSRVNVQCARATSVNTSDREQMTELCLVQYK